MPRNGSGTYTLPQSAFVSGTTISSAAMNSDLSDIASALTQSVSADGQTSITGVFKFLAGSSSTPSVTFTNDTTSGAYLASSKILGLTGGGLGALINGTAYFASGAPAVSAAGSNYVVGDQITLTGGTFTNPVVVQVATLSGSGVATVTLVEAGRYITQPANPVSQGSTTGAGTGATFTVSWTTTLALTDLNNAQLWQALGGTAFFKNNIVNANSIAGFLGSAAVTAYNLASNSVSPNLTMVNGTIVQSQNSNNQTFALKTLAGTDATSTNPILLVFRDVTATAGDFTVVSVTSAISITIPSGQGMGFVNATPARIWIGALNNGGTAELFVLNALTASSSSVQIFPLSGWGIISTSAVSGAANAQVAYSTTARTSKAYINLGYASWEAGNTIATAGTWNTTPSRLELFKPGVTPLPGTEIQRATSITTAYANGSTAFSTGNAIPQNTAGTQFLSQAITPISSTNVIEIAAQMLTSEQGTGSSIGAALFQDTTANALTAIIFDPVGANNAFMMRIEFQLLAATVSSTTFKVRIGNNNGNTQDFNGKSGTQVFNGVANSFLRVREIMA